MKQPTESTIHKDGTLTQYAALLSGDKRFVVEVRRDAVHEGDIIALLRWEPDHCGRRFIPDSDYKRSNEPYSIMLEVVRELVMEAQ